MIFNSLEFLAFFLVVLAVVFFLPKRPRQIFLLAASYIFYGWWDWRFLGLIFLSTFIDYLCGLQIPRRDSRLWRRGWLTLSLIVNFSLLGFFKYFHFFQDSFRDLVSLFGWHPGMLTLQIILPVGISFYTFQTLGYTLDVYRGTLRPCKDPLTYALFVAFFPQLVAGPVERAGHLLPQLEACPPFSFRRLREGMTLMFWGFFLKLYCADNLAQVVDPIFALSAPYRGVEVLFAAYGFTWQIFADFAGYSSIARGAARCLGVDICVNFRSPFAAGNPADFWRRWHISLSTWFRDYIYIPLGGNREGPFRAIAAVAVTMFLAGLWHGAAWTFVVWGLYHAVLIGLYRFLPQRAGSRPGAFLSAVLFFHLTALGFLVFRAATFTQAGEMLSALFSSWGDPEGFRYYAVMTFFPILPCALMHYLLRNEVDVVSWLNKNPWAKIPFYVLGYWLLAGLGTFGAKEFIYFQY